MGCGGIFRSVSLLLVMSHGPSGEVKCPVSFPREWIEIACARPVVRHCGRSWQMWRPRQAVGFLAPITLIKQKGSPPRFHTLHPCLRSHDCRHQSPWVPRLHIPASIEPASNCPHPQWIHGATLTSPSSAWRASSIVVFFVRGPQPRSAYYPVRRTYHHCPMAT